MKKRNILLAVAVCLSICAGAQSHHFSQFYAAPLLNNPAFTGNINGPYRVAANFRSQWLQGGSPYMTGTLSADFSPMQGSLREGNTIGVGLALVSDQSLGGALQTNSASISAAYNLTLDREGVHHLGVGLQGTYHERRLDYTKMTFENQFGQGGFDPSLPVGEGLNGLSKRYFDANAGMLYSYTMEESSFFGSVGAYNLLQHKEHVLAEEFRLPVRFSLLAGGQVNSGYAGIVYFSANHMQQGSARSTTLGAAYGVLLNDQGQELDLGLWYRIGDAAIPYVGYQLSTVKLGLSYDYTISQAMSGSAVRNAFELSLVYKAKDNSELKRLIPWY